MKNFQSIFKIKKPIIGMIHIKALPGTPKGNNDVAAVIDHARKEAEIYMKAGIDSIVIENMHDLPYLKRTVGPEIVSCMTAVACEVKNVVVKMPCGIQILAGANKEALAVAKAAKLDFVRAEGYVYAHVADEGIIESSAAEMLRYRKAIGADDVLVFTDVKKKHCSHAITSDVDIAETAITAEFFLSDGIIITGIATGRETDLGEVEAVKKVVNKPVIIGSGTTIDNVVEYLGVADALIVGTYFKKGGYWENELDYDKISEFMEKVNKFRK